MRKNYFFFKSLLLATVLLLGSANAWADTQTIEVLSENYESYSVGDITSTMQSNGWTFQSKNNKNEVTIVQGTSPNATKYFDFYYPDGGASRNQRWDFGVVSSLTEDNWTLTFSAALNPGTNNSPNVFSIVGTSSGNVATANNEVTNPYLKLKGTAATSTTYKPTFGATDYDESITLSSGTWYKFTIKATNIDDVNHTATIYVKITNYAGTETVYEKTVNNLNTTSIGNLRGICWNSPRGYSRLNLDDVLLTKEVDAATCAEPTSTLTAAVGTSRKFTLSCETPASTIYYSETEKAYGDDGWIEYTSEVTTDAATIYMYAATTSAHSAVTSFATGAGTEVVLNAPVISRSGNSVTITSDQSDKVGNPSVTIYYTYGGAPVEYTGAITVVADETITAYASATGYTNSDLASRAVALFPADVVKVINAPSNTSYTTGGLSGVDVPGINTTYQAIILDGEQWGSEDIYVQTTDFNIRNNGAWYINSTANVWVLVKNRVAGEILVFNNDFQASALTNATYSEKYSEGNNRAYIVEADGDVEIAFKKPDTKTMHYFYGLYAWAQTVPVEIGAAGFATLYTPRPLDFTGTGLEAYTATIAGSTVTLNPVTNVQDCTGVVLKGAAGTYNVPVILSSSTDRGSMLGSLTSATPFDAYYTYKPAFYIYGLAVVPETDYVQFTLVASGEIPAGKAYLAAAETSAKSLRVVVDGQASEVTAPEVVETEEPEVLYNMAGIPVGKDFKGYVINQKGEKRLQR